MIAFYPFENGDLVDASGNGNDLTNPTLAHPASDRNNNPDCAYEFDNYPDQGQFLTTTRTGFLNGLSAFSISVWYQPLDVTAAVGRIEGLVSRNAENRCNGRKGEWSVSLYDCRRALFSHNNSVWANLVSSGEPLCENEKVAPQGRWHDVVAVYNNGSCKIYFDGGMQETASGPAGCIGIYQVQDIGDLFIGDDYTGVIDDILIYNVNSRHKCRRALESEPCCRWYRSGFLSRVGPDLLTKGGDVQNRKMISSPRLKSLCSFLIKTLLS